MQTETVRPRLTELYRPQKFDDVIGQDDTIATLKQLILHGEIDSMHFLFAGPWGTGKTTLAKILARTLACERRKADEIDACGECGFCQEMQKNGYNFAIEELNAAESGGVDDVREWTKKAYMYPSWNGKRQVFIIDEAHALTANAKNALLNLLEDPRVIATFIFCTTEPAKMIETIKSRLTVFTLGLISNEEIKRRLVHICEEEGFQYEEKALDLIVDACEGHLRDAINLLHQHSRQLYYNKLEVMIKRSAHADAKDILKSIYAGNATEVLTRFWKFAYYASTDFSEAYYELVEGVIEWASGVYRGWYEDDGLEFTREELKQILITFIALQQKAHGDGARRPLYLQMAVEELIQAKSDGTLGSGKDYFLK